MLYYQNAQIGPPGLRGAVKFLVIANVLSWFVLVVVLQGFFFKSDLVFQWLGFVPHRVVFQFCWWQFVSYMFIHSTGVFHILINMLILWMFGSDLEQQRWGKRFFLIYYMVCGVGAAVVYVLAIYIYGLMGGAGMPLLSGVPVVGASGAVFGLLLAYGWVFRDRVVYFMLLFPMRARTFAFMVAAIELVQVLSYGLGHPVAGLAHLGGLLSGFLFLYFRRIQDQGWGGLPSWRRKTKFSSIKIVTDQNLH